MVGMKRHALNPKSGATHLHNLVDPSPGRTDAKSGNGGYCLGTDERAPTKDGHRNFTAGFDTGIWTSPLIAQVTV